MSLQQKKERELFLQKQNQEREVFTQMISMLSQTNAQLQTLCAQLQAQTLRDQTASAANQMPFDMSLAPAAQDPGGCTPDFSGLLAALTGGTLSGLAAGHAPSACAALQASAGSSPLRVADGAGDEDDDDGEVTIRGSPFCSAAAAASAEVVLTDR